MIEKITAHKREIESELQERVLALFQENAKPTDNVSIQVKLTENQDNDGHPTIHIKVKSS